MNSFARRVLTALLLALLTLHPPVNAESDLASEISPEFDPDAFEWAFGQVIDTITVTGNVKTRTIALLREMELRAGDQLDRIKLKRDQRYLTDLSSIATVVVDVYPVREGHCGLNITVTERPTIFLKLIYPIVEYNFNTNRFRYGLRVNNRNFRKRLETLSAGYTRNSVGDENASVGWQSRWIGLKHIGVGVWASYFSSGSEPVRLSVKEQTRLTTSRELALAALTNLEVDPERSVLLALEALKVAHTNEAEEVLHQAVRASRAVSSFRPHEGHAEALALSPDGKQQATVGTRTKST